MNTHTSTRELYRNRDNSPLDRNQVRRVAPSVFADREDDSRSKKYRFVSSDSLLDQMEEAGFLVVGAQEQRARKPDGTPTRKHLIRFAHRDVLEHNRDQRIEVVMINSHNGSCSYQLMAGIFRLVCTNGLMSALNTSADIFSDASLYLRVYVFGLLFLFIYNVCTGIFNAMGDSRTPLILLIISSVGNVILDIVFVAMLHWGVAGVAWATFIAQGASGVLAFVLLLRRVRSFDTGHHFVLFAPEMLRRLTNYAIPSIAQQSFVSVGNLIIQYYVNLCGPTVIAGFSVANRINMFALTCCMSFASGLSSYVAQNIGARKPRRVLSSMYVSLFWAFSFGVVFGVLTPPRRAGRRAAYGCPGRRGGADADHLSPGVRHGVRPGGGARSGGGCRMPPDPDLGGPQYGRRRHRHAAGVGGAGRRAHRTDGRQRRQPLECAAAGGHGRRCRAF